MSWIFGVFDPEGVDQDRVGEVAASTMREPPFLTASAAGEVVFGTGLLPGQAPGIAREDGHLLVADARVDALDERDLGSVEGAEAAGVLLANLRGAGPVGLDALAADFALAWFDGASGRLVLTRDATANRPLYWARRTSFVAFASDPRFLLELGACTGELDEDACARALAGVPRDSQLTGLEGLYRTLGGRWLEFAARGALSKGRWFRPERDPVDAAASDEAIQGVGEAIRVAARIEPGSGASACRCREGVIPDRSHGRWPMSVSAPNASR